MTGRGRVLPAVATLLLCTACSVDRSGLASRDATVRDAREDGGADCRVPRDCDDRVDCTNDRCIDGACRYEPDDSVCGADATCDPEDGCVGGCVVGDSCIAAGCETARCDGDTCVIEPGCEDGEVCCNGECCGDDGNPCTTTQCMPDGCAQVPNDGAACDDGVFCNGSDTCDGDSCSEHSMMPPCEGSLRCDADKDTCVGCAETSDCPDPIEGDWGECIFDGTCDESGTQQRTITSFECTEGGVCEMDTTTESRDCSRDTDGLACGATSCGTYGACDYSGVCDRTATQTRSCTAAECSGGACTDTSFDESRACSRDTNGTACDDGLYCTGDTDTCSDGSCTGSGDPCGAGEVCDEGTASCFECTTAGECDDGVFCNGPESCDGGSCVSGSSPCPDGFVCDEDTGACAECFDDGDCAEGVCDPGTNTCVDCLEPTDCSMTCSAGDGSCNRSPDGCPGPGGCEVQCTGNLCVCGCP